jgi:hypothetical protein
VSDDTRCESCDEWRRHHDLLLHKIIACGVAASHPDPALSRRAKDYGGKWDSPQAQKVREVRDERDALRALLAAQEARTQERIRALEAALRDIMLLPHRWRQDARDARNSGQAAGVYWSCAGDVEGALEFDRPARAALSQPAATGEGESSLCSHPARFIVTKGSWGGGRRVCGLCGKDIPSPPRAQGEAEPAPCVGCGGTQRTISYTNVDGIPREVVCAWCKPRPAVVPLEPATKGKP